MRSISLAMLLALPVSSCSANDDVPAPAIASVYPSRAVVGTSVAISGSNLCQQPPGDDGEQDPLACDNVGTVQFGASSVTPTQYTDTTATVVVPDLAPGKIGLRISVAGRTSNAVSLTIE